MKSGFFNRLVDRADKINKELIIDFMIEIAQERDLWLLVFDSMIEGMMVLDVEGMVAYINHSARQILGLGDGSTTPEISYHRMLNDPNLRNLCQEGMNSSEPILRQELIFRSRDDHRALHVNRIPLLNKGIRLGTLFLFIDETENKAREQKLLEAEKLAALTTLTAGMSHEIRNPLNSLSIHLQLLQRHWKKKNLQDDEVEEILQIFSKEIKRLNEVVEMFLMTVRPSQPRMRLLSLSQLITDTLTLMEPEFLQHNIQVSLLEEGEWPYVEADEVQLKQALINILRNAVEAIVDQTPEERAQKTDEVLIQMVRNERTVTLIFIDTGKGIKRENLRHIFEPYFTTKAKGTGLGLMIVDRIIREHNGTITPHSEPGKGTQIAITLPVAAESPKLLKHEKSKNRH